MQNDLVSCIMPTANRRRFVPQAILYFLEQDYEAKELVILDDGEDVIVDLVPDHPAIRYVRLTGKRTLGAKRNECVAHSRGEFIVHWDDDDWSAPHRISYQVQSLQESGADVAGTNAVLFYDITKGEAKKYVYPPNATFWLSGNTLCYRRTYWEQHRFRNITVGEDGHFVWEGDPHRMVALPDSTFHVGIIHPGNVSPKNTKGSWWRPFPLQEIRRLLGPHWGFYQGGEAAPVENVVPQQLIHPIHDTPISMITVAKESDLSLPEFAAFGQGQTLPRMRRWELPFALFQSRLTDTMSVLDCTINPVNFKDRLTALYPHLLYRHHNPIQNGNLSPPLGVPDGAFDRVICVNTLEHLLKHQRDALIAKMSRALKPGGWLILTSDYYFDSFWQNPNFLTAGVMRSDRQEIFNGWNKVTISEWRETCSRFGLFPMSDPVPEPTESDPGLFLNSPPFSHACIGGLFCKGDVPHILPGKKIVLALLAWNTRTVTVDSVRAHLREAHMLRRLGFDPFVCVCDNGSTDGTVPALRAIEEQVDVPHAFIYNSHNLGNSIARNQIISRMLAEHGDYLLFMDGDIEIVPFSSVALLRYMESSGHYLGSIGADSNGQTNIRSQATPSLFTINGLQVETTNLVAWTQYGLFRREVFEEGIRFDESTPFDQAGWGFEDNDLAFQMEMKGYLSQRFFGMKYLHRNARSSIRIMRELGVDAADRYRQRKQYVINKWAHIPKINDGPLSLVRKVNMQV